MKINAKRFSETEIIQILCKTPYATAIFIGENLTIEGVNEAMLKIWGRSADVIGMELGSAMPELQGQPFIDLLKNVWHSGTSYEATNTPATLTINGVDTIRFFDFIYRPIFDEEGKIYCILNTAVDVTDRHKKILSTTKTEEILEFSIAAANVGLWHLDGDTKHLTASPRLKELFGFPTNDEMSLEWAFNQIPEGYRQQIRSSVDTVLANGGSYDMEHPIMRWGDQKLRWVRAIGRVYNANADSHSHLSGVMIDITDQKMHDIRKNDFISMVSHELKTPLTSLSGYAELLLSMVTENNNGFMVGALGKMNRQIRKMGNLINRFLTLSRLESGNSLYLDKTVFNIDELMREVIEEQKLISSNTLIHLHDCNEIEIYADRAKIGSVLENLLSNANKYSTQDKNIQLTCEHTKQRIQISVADNGIGISPSNIKNLFQRYYRVDENKNQSYSGFGLGLYLSAEIIAAHNGKIWVESEEGRGSTFYFELPLGNDVEEDSDNFKQ